MSDTDVVTMPQIAAGSGRTHRLPSSARLLAAQISYQVRLLLASKRSIVVGLGLPVILLVASRSKTSPPDVGGFAVLGLTITAWTTYGVRLVAAREAGVLKRWRATPLPRWCYFAGSILATTVVAAAAGAATILAAFALWGSHFGDGPGVQLTATGGAAILVAFILGGLAWSSSVTAVTSAIPNIDASFPILILTYFPVIIVSGVLFSINEPHWLRTLATYLPAEPLIDAVRRAVSHGGGVGSLPAHDLLVLGAWAVAGILAAVALFRWEPHRPTQARS